MPGTVLLNAFKFILTVTHGEVVSLFYLPSQRNRFRVILFRITG